MAKVTISSQRLGCGVLWRIMSRHEISMKPTQICIDGGAASNGTNKMG